MGFKCYDFECPKCEKVFEDFVENDNPLTTCPDCGFRAAKRLMPATKLGFMNDPVKKTEELKKRSEEHTKSEQKKGNIPSPKDYIGK